MTSRERVLRTLQFEPTDRAPYDLFEGEIWPTLMDYFRHEHGLEDRDQVHDFLGTDFRWIERRYLGPEQITKAGGEPMVFSQEVAKGPLAGAETIAEVEAYEWPDPAWWQPGDYAAARQRWPEHALVFLPGCRYIFWSACQAFGMEAAMLKMLTAPKLFDAFVRCQHEFNMDMFFRNVKAARGHCDICYLGDDFASQQSMLISPDLWRKHVKPYLAEEVRLARDHGMVVFYHSCGAVRPILADLIDVGVNALLVFQTSAVGMDAESIAREFGGRLAFCGGIDVQRVLSYGTPEQVQAAVEANVRAFADCGGYIVANSHHGIDTVRGENIVAMCNAAKNRR